MPLFKGRFDSPKKPTADLSPTEAPYTIPYTNERFRTKEEYEARLALYKEPVWTCQATGQIHLTHKEAWDSEQETIKMLKEEFPQYLEKPVLEIVHHSTDVLDVLTDRAWRKLHEEFHLGEPVLFKAAIPNKNTEGIIIRVAKSETVANVETSNCSSPSSNKENTDHDNMVKKSTKVDIAEAMKSNSSISPGKMSRKYNFPKLLPYKYAVRLKNDMKIVADIPANDLKRVHHLPVKELVKTFIRTYAWRGGSHQSSPWVVKQELVKKYNLTNKIADIFLSPSKMYELGRKILEEKKKSNQDQDSPKKRKSSQALDKSKAAKKLKMDSPRKAQQSEEDSSPKSSNSVKKSPKKSPKPEATSQDGDSDSSEDDLPLVLLEHIAAKRRLSASLSPRKRGRPKKSEAEAVRAEKELLAKAKALKKKLKEKARLEKASKKSPSSAGKQKKLMKQLTLFEMKGKKKASSTTPKKSPTKSPKKSVFKIPPLAQRLMKAQDAGNRPVYHQLIGRCARDLPMSQIKQLPEKIREPILKRCRTYEERKKLAKMTPEEKEEYLKQKKEERKKKLNAMLKNKRLEQNRRFEDTDLVLKPIPTPRLVETPDGLANELFGSVVMVTEFINCYHDLFTPKDDTTVINVTTESLMNSLVGDSKRSGPVAHILITLLQTLLQDGITEDYKELGLKLSEIPVNQYTVSELLRLCLRRQDKLDLESDSESQYSDLTDDEDVPEELIERLEMCEFYELEAEEKLEILLALCHRLMCSYSVEDHMEEKQRRAAELWKRRIAEQKERNERKKGEKKKMKEMKGKLKKESPKSSSKPSASDITLDSFYTNMDDAEAEKNLDLASVVKRRRIMAELKRKQMEEERIRKEKEAEEIKKQKEMELLEKEFQDNLMAAKLAFRKSPLGTDRNHNRYWLFHKSTPGLFVEKGWASVHITYTLRNKDGHTTSDSSDSDSETFTQTTELKRGRKTYDRSAEKTIPRTGQNLWFIYDHVSDVDQLLENLHPLGVRESLLKAKLKEFYKIIINSVEFLNKQQPIKPEPVNLVEGFREELLDMETRLTAGGLGGVPNETAWIKKLKKANTVEEFGGCLIECQTHIYERFLKGIMVLKAKASKVRAKKEEDVEVKMEDGTEGDEQNMIAIGIEKWKEAVGCCTTFSRLHVLMGILDSCIKWEKSAENAKCKICRKKADEDRLLLCDQCNQAYHLYCLRPALVDIPVGEWFCPACAPPARRVTRIRNENKDYRTLAGYSEESECEEPEPNETECAVCGGDEGIFPCSTCPLSFHLDCHEPPLRREPRSTWRCVQCTSGIQIAKSRRTTRKQKYKYNYESDDDFEEKPKKTNQQKQKTLDGNYFVNTTQKQKRKNSSFYQDSDEESEEESSKSDSSEEETVHNYRGQKARLKRVSSQSNTSHHSDSHDKSSPANSRLTRQRSGLVLVNGELLPQEVCDAARKVMMDVLRKLRSHRCAWPFMEPVDPDEVPDYYTVIHNPIDLQTVENKCVSEQYKDPQHFVDDIALMFTNSYVYNTPDSVVGKCTKPLETHFVKLVQRHLPECTYPRLPSANGSLSSENDCHVIDHDYFSSRTPKQ